MDHIVALGFFLFGGNGQFIHSLLFLYCHPNKKPQPSYIKVQYVRNFSISKFSRENYISLYHMFSQIQTISFYELNYISSGHLC
jgi:hypothetical protein